MSSKSKQAAAKEKQGYVAKAVPRTCMNCAHFHYDSVEYKGAFGSWFEDKNLRCVKGEFAVKKMATCNEFEPIPKLANVC